MPNNEEAPDSIGLPVVVPTSVVVPRFCHLIEKEWLRYSRLHTTLTQARLKQDKFLCRCLFATSQNITLSHMQKVTLPVRPVRSDGFHPKASCSYTNESCVKFYTLNS